MVIKTEFKIGQEVYMLQGSTIKKCIISGIFSNVNNCGIAHNEYWIKYENSDTKYKPTDFYKSIDDLKECLLNSHLPHNEQEHILVETKYNINDTVYCLFNREVTGLCIKGAYVYDFTARASGNREHGIKYDVDERGSMPEETFFGTKEEVIDDILKKSNI